MARIRVTVEVNSDGVPGFFFYENEESFVVDFQRMLDDNIRHYNPQVVSAKKIVIEEMRTDFLLKSKEDCEKVLDALRGGLTRGHYFTLSDVKTLVDMRIKYSDFTWSKKTLDDVTIREIEEGFLLDFPAFTRETSG